MFVGVGGFLLENMKEGNLTFPQINIENAGKYICEAGNNMGHTLQKTASIIVHGKNERKILISKLSCMFCVFSVCWNNYINC